MFRKIYLLFKILLIVILVSFGIIIINYKLISISTRDSIFDDINLLPDYSVILIPGVGDSVNNYYFKGRIDAAVEIFYAKKIRVIIVSGRDDLIGYDEPHNMLEALIDKEIHAGIIMEDYGASRTIETIKNIKSNYGTDSIIIVSQKPHLERALFISSVLKMHAVGYIAKENLPEHYIKYYRFRELIARLKCTYDCVKYKLNIEN